MSQVSSLHLDSDYKSLLNTLKTQIKSAQFRAALTELVETVSGLTC